MKLASTALLALLADSEQFIMADLYTFTLAGGSVLRYSAAPTAVLANGHTFGLGPKFERSKTKVVIGTQVDELEIKVYPEPTDLIGVLPFLEAAWQGQLDGALLQLERSFMPSYGDTTPGTVVLFAGRISDIDCSRTGIEMKCRSHLELLNIQMPRRLWQASYTRVWRVDVPIRPGEPGPDLFGRHRLDPDRDHQCTKLGDAVHPRNDYGRNWGECRVRPHHRRVRQWRDSHGQACLPLPRGTRRSVPASARMRPHICDLHEYFQQCDEFRGLPLHSDTGDGGMTSNGLIAYPARDLAGNQNIFLMAQDGSGARQLTYGPDNALPSWSPDGQQIAYVAHNKANGFSLICTMNADGSQQRPIAMGTTPEWSPDGAWIAIAVPGHLPHTDEIAVIKPDGSAQRLLTINQANVHKVHPTWSHDGLELAYIQVDQPGHPSVWTMNSIGSHQRQLTRSGSNNLDVKGKLINTANEANSPNWGPDGRIAFWSGVEGNAGQIWAINPDGTGRTQLTHAPLPSNNDDPAWSPYGQKILFGTNRNGSQEMWLRIADGSDQRKLARSAAGPLPGDAAWQPIR